LKQLTLIISSLLIFGSLVACSFEPAPKDDNQQEENKPSESTEQANHKGSTKQTDENESVAMIKEQVKLGLTKEEVENNLGSDYQKVKASDDDSEIWRYDFGEKEDYTSPDNEYDTGDIKGIQSGNIEAQLFISWNDEDKVSNYSVLYLNSSDGRVYEYRVFSDGEERVQAITN
jgi:hypothetical protein